MASAILGQTISFSVSAGDVIYIDAGGVGSVNLYVGTKQVAQHSFSGSQRDIAILEDGTASIYLASGSCNYFVNDVEFGADAMSRDQRKVSQGNASVGNGAVYDTDGTVLLQTIHTEEATIRGVAHRGGWPSSSQGNQLMGVSMWLVEPGSDYQLRFVGASQRSETISIAGTANAYVEAPAFSGNWYQVTQKGSPNLTFIQDQGTTPSAANNYFIIDADPIPIKFADQTLLRVAVSARGGWPCMSNYDGYFEGRPSLEFCITNVSANIAALQLATIGTTQINNIINAIQLNGTANAPRVAAAANYSGGALAITAYSHGIASATNNKVILSGWVNSGTALDGIYSFTTSGGDGINITMSDPGTISQLGVVTLASAITSATWSGGTLTVTRAAHGYVPGQVITVQGTTATGSSINGDLTVDTVPTADTFTVAFASNAGTITTTNACMFPKYAIPSADFHLRPYTIRALSNVACQALFGDSTTQTVGRILDNTRLCGVTQQLVGRVFPFCDLSANSESLPHWLGTPGETIIRQQIIGDSCQAVTYGDGKNSEATYTTYADWKAGHDAWWALPQQAALRSSPYNIAVGVPSGAITSRDDWTSIDGQSTPNSKILPQFQQYLQSLVGTLYRKYLNYAAGLTNRNQPYSYRVNVDTPTITFSTTAGSPDVTVSAISSGAFTDAYDGAWVFLPGAGASGGNTYAIIKWVSSTRFFAMSPNEGIFTPLTRAVAVSAVTNGTGRINPRRCIAYSAGQTNTIHENPRAMYEAAKEVWLNTILDI